MVISSIGRDCNYNEMESSFKSLFQFYLNVFYVIHLGKDICISQLINMMLLYVILLLLYISAIIIILTIIVLQRFDQQILYEYFRYIRINRRNNIEKFHTTILYMIIIFLRFLFQKNTQDYFGRHQFHFLTINSDRLHLPACASKSAWKNSHVPRIESYDRISLHFYITLVERY